MSIDAEPTIAALRRVAKVLRDRDDASDSAEKREWFADWADVCESVARTLDDEQPA